MNTTGYNTSAAAMNNSSISFNSQTNDPIPKGSNIDALSQLNGREISLHPSAVDKLDSFGIPFIHRLETQETNRTLQGVDSFNSKDSDENFLEISFDFKDNDSLIDEIEFQLFEELESQQLINEYNQIEEKYKKIEENSKQIQNKHEQIQEKYKQLEEEINNKKENILLINEEKNDYKLLKDLLLEVKSLDSDLFYDENLLVKDLCSLEQNIQGLKPEQQKEEIITFVHNAVSQGKFHRMVGSTPVALTHAQQEQLKKQLQIIFINYFAQLINLAKLETQSKNDLSNHHKTSMKDENSHLVAVYSSDRRIFSQDKDVETVIKLSKIAESIILAAIIKKIQEELAEEKDLEKKDQLIDRIQIAALKLEILKSDLLSSGIKLQNIKFHVNKEVNTPISVLVCVTFQNFKKDDPEKTQVEKQHVTVSRLFPNKTLGPIVNIP